MSLTIRCTDAGAENRDAHAKAISDGWILVEPDYQTMHVVHPYVKVYRRRGRGPLGRVRRDILVLSLIHI